MQNAPTPQDENLRLNDLLSHHILDSDEEENYNELLEIAAQLCGCPVALISLVDKDRQWFKSKINIEAPELPRDTSFCGHAINQQDVFMVEDARNDERFFDNPHVTGELQLGFYAGAPITSKSGFNLGTVCVIDHQPKTLTTVQQETLKKIASQISKMMEAHKKDQQVKRIAGDIIEREKKNKQNFEMLFMQSSFPKIIFSAGGIDILAANGAALKLYGYEREEFLKLTALDLRANKSKEQMQRRVAKVESEANVSMKAKHLTKEGKLLSVSLDFSTVFFNEAEARLANITDFTEEKNLHNKLKDEKEKAERKILEAAIKVKQKEKDNITDALRENINQVLACTNLYLSIAAEEKDMSRELIEKSRKNVLIAMDEIKKLYRPVNSFNEDSYLKDGLEELVLKYELLRSFRVHYTFEGNEQDVPEEVRMQVYTVINDYFDAASKAPGVKNVWLTVKFDNAAEVIIKNDNSQPDSRKRQQYMEELNKEVGRYNGIAQLFENGNASCTLHIFIPNEEVEVVETKTNKAQLLAMR